MWIGFNERQNLPMLLRKECNRATCKITLKFVAADLCMQTLLPWKPINLRTSFQWIWQVSF